MYVYLLYPHVVNNCIKRHINVPTYSASQETVLQDQYVDGNQMYGYPGQMPYMGQGMYPNMGNANMGCGCGNPGMMYANNQMQGQYSPMQYQGNIGTNAPNMMPQYNPGMNTQFNY
jgi:hypothetical protein